MKRLILAGLCCVMLAGCTNANPDSISEGEVHLGEVLDQTGHSFSYVASGSELTAGLYTDGEGCVPHLGPDGEGTAGPGDHRPAHASG